MAWCGWGRAERRGKGRSREGGAGKGEVPADNGAYVCLREWDGVAAAAAAGGRRCAAAAAGPSPGPPGLRAAPTRSSLPYSTPPLPPPTPASGVSGTWGGGETPERGLGGPGPRPRVLSRSGGRSSQSRGEPKRGWEGGKKRRGGGRRGCGYSELSLEKPAGGGGGGGVVLCLPLTERWGETKASQFFGRLCPMQCLERLNEETGRSQGPSGRARWRSKGNSGGV